MKSLPWPIRHALDNRIRLGSAAVADYWENDMSAYQRNYVDRWLMCNRPDLLEPYGKGPQRWRFIEVIETLYLEYQYASRYDKQEHSNV